MVPLERRATARVGLSQNGDEESTLYLRDVEKKRRFAKTRSSAPGLPRFAWLPDGKSFYYTRYPDKGSVPAGEENYHRTVYLHRVGDDPSKDAYVFGKELKMTDSPGVDISPDGRWLVVSVHEGWAKNELGSRDLKDTRKTAFVPLVTGVEAIFDATVLNDVIYVRTNDGAPRYKLYAVSPKRLSAQRWKELIAEAAESSTA